MAWHEKLIFHLGPGAFSGITFPVWLQVLRENNFSIDAPYWGRAASITLNSLLNSGVAAVEDVLFRQCIRLAHVKPPLFVLGIWRSGTTYLHTLLCQDRRF